MENRTEYPNRLVGTAPRRRRVITRRTGKALVRLLIATALLTTSGVAAWRIFPRKSVKAGWQEPLLVKVENRPFVHEVVERGEVESSNSVEIRCEVASRATSGTTILEIVPEGTLVQKGDILAKLDDSAMRIDFLTQQIVCNNSEAQVIQARADVEAARLALEEYQSGIFGQEEELLESMELVAKENLRRAEEYLQYSQKLAERGYVSGVQLEADKFAVEKARKELDVAEKKLDVLRTYTRQRTVNKLKADIATSEAQLRSKENSFKLDESRLAQIKQQLEKCVIRAPSEGQVVYAKEPRSQEHVVGEGLPVRERQIMFTLPDPKRMRVLAKVHESRIDHVRTGMNVNIKLDAFPDAKLRGVVRNVSDYPLPSVGVYSSHIKEYAVHVEIVEPMDSLRPGLTAEVAIQVVHRDEASLVPVYSVLEHQGQHFCLLKGEQQELLPRPVTLGPTNEEYAVIEAGLKIGETIVANPHSYEGDVSFAAYETDLSSTSAKEKAAQPTERTAEELAPIKSRADTKPGVKRNELASRETH